MTARFGVLIRVRTPIGVLSTPIPKATPTSIVIP